ncbi:hypothetical protein KI387_043766 [Taxus chinensis]|uniref:Uncharacterized protein n=1 Tax=Taxus chinensis TaxID=29808 RepID=A0AA38LNJ6_TAXCH|nr:hypothetical protein KI387_043766 [Taxus chinensis]
MGLQSTKQTKPSKRTQRGHPKYNERRRGREGGSKCREAREEEEEEDEDDDVGGAEEGATPPTTSPNTQGRMEVTRNVPMTSS